MFYFFYYFPLGLDVRPRRAVWATWMLVGTCAGAFVFQRLAPALFWVNYGAFVFVPSSPSPSSLLFNAYFHGGWLHLVSNMLTLVVVGPVLEDRLGSRRFLLLYHVANVFANLVQGVLVLLFLPAQAGYGVLGASGAIAGLLGLVTVRLYFARLRLGYWAFMPLQAFTRCGTATVPLGFAIAMWFGMQLGIVLLQGEGAGAGVACGSHLGGVLGGVGMGLLLGLGRAAQDEQHLQRGRRYLDQAQWYAAQGELIEYVRRQPNDIQGHLELARTYRLTGWHPQADRHYRAACERFAAAKQLDRVEEVYVEAERGNLRFALDARRQLQLAQALDRSLKPDAAARAYQRLAEAHPDCRDAPLGLYRAARLSACDASRLWHAAAIYQRLVERYPQAAETPLARAELSALPTAA